MWLVKGAPNLMQRLSRLPSAPHLTLLDCRKPKPFPWPHITPPLESRLTSDGVASTYRMHRVNRALSNSALRRSIEFLEDCETRAYILVDVRTSLASGRPAVSAVRSACVRAVAEENREMPALSHIGSRNPGDATCANTG